MTPNVLVEVLSAAHLTRYVDHQTFASRGGIMIVSPPGSLKSSIIRDAMEGYPDVINISDLNVQTLSYMKSSLTDGKYTTIALGEYEKIYQRNPATASNIEGQLKAMVEEGFGRNSFEDQRMVSLTPARVLLIGGITPSCYQRLFTHWMENGFARRFIWVYYTLANPEAITQAIHDWKPLTFGKIIKQVPANCHIPYNITTTESTKLRKIIEFQPAHETPYVLLKKIFCVLKWRYSAKKAMRIVEEFATCIGKQGGKLEI